MSHFLFLGYLCFRLGHMKLTARSHHYWETTCFIVGDFFVLTWPLLYNSHTKGTKKGKASDEPVNCWKCRNKAVAQGSWYCLSCSDKELSFCSLLLTRLLWQPACQALAQERAGGRPVQHAQTTFSLRKSKRARDTATAVLALPTPYILHTSWSPEHKGDLPS